MGKRARSDVTLPETLNMEACVEAIASDRAIVLAFDALGVPITQKSKSTVRNMAHKTLYEFAYRDTPYGTI